MVWEKGTACPTMHSKLAADPGAQAGSDRKPRTFLLETPESPCITARLQVSKVTSQLASHRVAPGRCGFSLACCQLLATVWGDGEDVTSATAGLDAGAAPTLPGDFGEDT